jgi:hypothetical protein
LLGDVAKSVGLISIATGLAENCTTEEYFSWFASDLGDNVPCRPLCKCSIVDGFLRVYVEAPRVLQTISALEYAVYLIKDSAKIKVFWYQASPIFETTFDGSEVDAIQVFVRDSFQNVLHSYLPYYGSNV